MGLIRNVTDEMKKNNKNYTNECREIYENIRFCKVQMMSLYSAVVPIVFGFFAFCLLFVNIYYIIGLTSGKPFGATNIVAIVMFVIFLTITVGISVFYIIKYRKKSEPRYFVKDDGGEFEIYCDEIQSGDLKIITIVHTERKKVLYINNHKCTVDIDTDKASERNGFYEFIVTPDKVFPKDDCPAPKYCYKKKKVRGNTTYYYFSAFDNLLFGTRKARSIKLVNGVVESISQQTFHYTSGTNSRNSSSYKYEYSHVNDDSFKLHIPKIAQEQAEKLKFVLPQESANIIYDKE